MAATKYGKYILRPPKQGSPASSLATEIPVTLAGLKDWAGIKHRMKWSFITAPVLLVDSPHSHDFDEILGFYSCDPAHERDFSAQIELALGREGEKQIIVTPGLVCLPKGLIHCPLNFTRVDKPVIFIRIYVSPQYSRIPVS
jgi:hypothetical protein